MSRAKWKGPFVNEYILNQSLTKFTLHNDENINIKTTSKNSEIISNFVGATFSIYNGKIFSDLEIKKEMVGHKLGEFIFTRSHSPPKKKKIKQKVAYRKKEKVKDETKS